MCRWSILILVILLAIGCRPNSQEPVSVPAESSNDSSAEQKRSNTLAVYPTRKLSDLRTSSVASFADLENEIRKLNWDEPSNVPEVIFSHDPVTTNKESISVHGSFAATSDDGRLEIQVTTIGADGVYHHLSSKSAKSVDDIVAAFKAYYEKTDDWREQLQWVED